MSTSFGVDFGQKVDLTASIRNILRNYPEGTAVLKELIQNADDAGARKVCFTLDKRTHATASLAAANLAQFQGPALLVYNDAIFSKTDFQSIQRIGDSLKRAEEESKAKIGRFGIGFNAVYHWTELPSFISQNYLVLLDPQARFLPNVNPSNPGKMVDFIGDKTVLQSHPDQFVPYKVHGLEWNKAFKGTLFRLPLRTPQQSETSLLSKRALSISEAEQLLNHFSYEASSMLLFLKSIECIEVKVWEADGREPQPIFSCSIDSPSSTLRTERNLVLKGLKSSSSSSSLPLSVLTADYTLSMSCIRNSTEERYAERWEVCTQLGGGAASEIATDPSNALLKLIPYGGVAVLVNDGSSRSNGSMIPGMAYCFLPLPIETQLPVMVNGFFELSSNRRDVWQAGSDMTGEGRTRAEWNISLMKDVISPAYVRLLLRLKATLHFTSYFQSIFPSVRTPAPWNLVANSVLSICKTEKLLAITYTNVSKYVVTDKGWIPCQEAVIMPRKSDIDHSIYDDICTLLIRCAQKYVACTDNLRDILEDSSLTKAIAAPIFIRNMLKEGGPISMSREWGPRKSLCRSILSYVMTDLIMLTQGQELDQLNALPILPLHGTNECGVLRTYNQEQSQILDAVVGMGFGVGQALHALEKHNFNQDHALEYMMTSDIDLKKLQTPPLFVIAEREESEVFMQASSILLDQSCIPPSEFSILTSPVFVKRSNIRPFTSNVIKDILYYILPAEFFTATGSAINLSTFNSETQQMVAQFLCALWEYVLSRDDMVAALADGVPLVPVSSNHNVYPLSKISALYLPQYNKEIAPTSLLRTLQTVGAATIDCDILDPSKISSRTFLEYVNLPNRQGLLCVFASLLRSNRDVFIGNVKKLNSSQKEELVTYFATEGPLSSLLSADITTIRALPIFRSVWDQDSYIAPEQENSMCLAEYSGIHSSLFPPYFILHRTSNEFALLSRIGVTVISRAQYFKQTFLPSIDELFSSCVADTGNADIVINTLLIMLSETKLFADEDSTFMSYLQSVRFVPHMGINGELLLEKVTELFDPSDAELVILMASTSFPIEEFRRDDILVILRLLGLQTTLEWPGVIACAKSIATSSESENSDARLNRAKNLLLFIDKNVDKLTGLEERKKKENNALLSLVSYFTSDEDRKLEDAKIEGFRNELVSIPWLPASPEPLNSFLPWMTPINSKGSKDNTITVRPAESRPMSDQLLCSGSYYIIDHSVSSNLGGFLGWKTELPFRAIALQLRHIANNFIKANDDTESTPSSPSAEQQRIREMITALIPQLYQRLNTACAGFQGDAMEIVRILEGIEWIWVGNNFVSSERVAYNPTVNAEPYLHCLPQDLSVYKNLLSAFGVKPQFTATDYVGVLQVMTQQQKDGGELDTELAVAVVTLLTTDLYWQQGVSLLLPKIYIPDQSGKMLTASELVNDDVPWQAGPEYSSVRIGLHFVHPNISSKVAEKLGVKSLRMLLVNKSLEQQLFSAPESSVESFGQAESLTSRLKTILDMYPDGNPIFSELIQNADDAGASKLCIVIDENSYGSESVLGPTMAALQGPSVLVYNDAKFTESDYKSLARIGQGSKLDRLATTGRFGLGFNSVYHITDTPSFVSGDHLVFFDPHTTYVPGANSLQPGLRIKFVGSQLDITFPDQFAPFKYFGCDFKTTYEGTLFRFPLRTSNLARASEISHRSYSVDDVNSILKNLQDQLAQHLLFLRSVRCIEIYRYNEDMKAAGTSPVLIQRALSTPYDYSFVNDQKLLNFLERKKNNEDSKITSRDAFYKVLSQTRDDDLPVQSYKMKIEVGVQSEGVTGAKLENSRSTLYHIVSGLRGGDAKITSCSPETRHLKLIPFAAIACALSAFTSLEDQDFMKPVPLSGQAFCFLPLPIKTGLPVHVNGHFELSSNRRDIWSGDDTTGESKLRSNWNKMILRDVITPLYTKLIIDQAEICVNEGQPKYLLDLLPCPQPVAPWDIITSNIFDLLKNQKIFYSNLRNGIIISPSSSFLFDFEDKMISGSIISRDELESMLLMEDIPVVGLNSKIFKTITDNCRDDTVAGVISPQLMREYFTPNSAIDRYFQRKGNFLSLPPNEPVTTCKNAIFWLTYCLHDLDSPASVANESDIASRKDYTSLYGLKLMPMEDGSLGVIGDPTDPPLYIASENERKLLRERGANVIIASDQVLGPFIVGKLSKQDFIDITNISRLTPVDVLKLLRSVLPKSWFASEKVTMAPSPTLSAAIVAAKGEDASKMQRDVLVNGGVVERAGVLSDEWLQALWGYIMESNSLDLFKGTLPLLPVRGWSQTTQQHIAQISPQLPVLHMTFRDLSADTMEALASLGIRILDSHVLGQFSYSTTMDQFLIPRTPRGIIQAFSVIDSKISSVSSTWDVARKDAIRKFIYTEVLSKSKSFAEEDILILRKFSVYRKYVSKSAVNDVDIEYTDLMEKRTHLKGEGKSEKNEEEYVLKLPPPVAAHYLMTSEFIKTDDETERNNLLKLEIQRMGVGHFVSKFVLPQLSSNRLEEKVDEISTFILSSLSKLKQDLPGITETLSNCAFIKVSNGKMFSPKDLYDPSISEFRLLLGQEAFPSSIIYGDTHLAALRSLGLNTTFNCKAIIKAASVIESNVNLYLSEEDGEDSALYHDTLRRGRELLLYLDNNIMALLKEADSEGFQKFVALSDQLAVANTTALQVNTDASDPDDHAVEELKEVKNSLSKELSQMELGGKWGHELRQIRWVPVLTSPPSTIGGSSSLIPWPERIHNIPMAAPSQCVTSANLWIGSNSQRICSLECRSLLLNTTLGWSKPISGRIVALQLIGLVDVLSKSQNNSLAASQFYAIVPKIYNCLSVARERESQESVELWSKLLRNRNIIWTGRQFVQASRVAFQPISENMNTEPFLFVVEEELLPYGPLLSFLGVREKFEVSDLLSILSDLRKEYRNEPLSTKSLELCIGLLKLSYRLLEENEGSNTIKTGLYLPNRAGIMMEAVKLTYDDAPWVSAGLKQHDTPIQFVHSGISTHEAKLFGARSLREQLFSGDEIVCPSADAVSKTVDGDTMLNSILDLLAMCDSIKAKDVSVIFDNRQHPAESLMHPGLSTTQGAAVVVYIDKMVLSTEDLIKLATKISLIPMLNTTKTEKQERRSSFTGNQNEDPKHRYPTTGKKLISAFAITDCLQVLSGSQYFVFDPLGQYLLNDAAAGEVDTPDAKFLPSSSSSSRAQRCDIAKDEIKKRFPDQFVCMLNLPIDSSADGTRVHGTVLRLPYRRAPSSISGRIMKNEDCEKTLSSLPSIFDGSLLFSQHIERLSCYRYDEGIAQPTYSYRANAHHGSLASRNDRLKLLKDKSWKSFGLTSIFSQFVPIEYKCKITIQYSSQIVKLIDGETETVQNSGNSSWSVMSVLGAGLSRDLASRSPYRSLKLPPVVTMATEISRATFSTEAPSTAPFTGCCYCGSQPIAIVGIPFHVEAPFIQNLGTSRAFQLAGSSMRRSGSFSLIEDSSVRAPDETQIKEWNSALLMSAIDWILPKLLVQIKDVFQSIQNERNESPLSPASGLPMLEKTSAEGIAIKFYRYWPYQSRMPPLIKTSFLQTTANSVIAQQPVFVVGEVFKNINEAQLVTTHVTPMMSKYLANFFSLSSVPAAAMSEVILTLGQQNDPCYPRLNRLTASRMRELLRRDQALHLNNLRENIPLLLQLLSFSLSDYNFDDNAGEFVIRRAYKEMSGVPTLLMCDMSIRALPMVDADRICVAPYPLQALLPQLRSFFLHPYVLMQHKLFYNTLFQDSNFISFFNCHFLAEHLSKIFPSVYKSVPVILRISSFHDNESSGGKSSEGKETHGSVQVPSVPQDTDVMLYALWKYSLLKENFTNLNKLSAWPVIPCVSRGRRVLLSPSLLPFILVMLPTSSQDTERAKLAEEMTKLDATVNERVSKDIEGLQRGIQTSNSASGQRGDALDGDVWNWTKEPPSFTFEQTLLPTIPPLPQAAIPDKTAPAVSATAVTGAGGTKEAPAEPTAVPTDEIDDQALMAKVLSETIDTHLPTAPQTVVDQMDTPSVIANPAPPPPPSAHPQRPSMTVNSTLNVQAQPMSQLSMPAQSRTVFPPVSVNLVNGECKLERGPCGSVDTPLALAVSKLGLPFFDVAILDGLPEALPVPKMIGRQLLESLYFMEYNCLLLQSPTSNNSSSVETMLHFDVMDYKDRNTILYEILAAHNDTNLTSEEVNKLKTLRLLTKNNGESFSMNECTGGAFWCTRESALDGISLPGLEQARMTSSVIIKYDSTLRELYTLLGIEELTPSSAIKRFTIPSLATLSVQERVNTMQALASKWGNYSDDTELIDALKAIPFVPQWKQELNGYWECNWEAEARLPSSLFNWQNIGLMSALQGTNLPAYTVPPLMRSAEWSGFLSTLGLQNDLDKEGFIRVVSDIEKAGVEIENNNESNAVDHAAIAMRGRRVLRYIKEGDRLSSLFDHELAKRTGKIAFVPVNYPVKVENGGFVEYESRVVSFEKTMSSSNGTLAFTVLPVVEDDIIPDQIYASALGILYSPPIEIVLRHLRNLTIHGDTLDRWNNSRYSIQDTFSSIYVFLKDHWRELQPSIKSGLEKMNIIPVNQILVKPSRVFFRLGSSEDLSPFMFELPRVFGSHEIFLKEIGVKETPNSSDYCLFLNDLQVECKNGSLNPNELKAVLAITHAIADQQQQQTEPMHSVASLCLPDETGVLRRINHCLLCDDLWLKSRCVDRIREHQFYILHPFIPLEDAMQLGVRKLSQVVSETLGGQQLANKTSLEAAFTSVTSPRFLASLSALLLNRQHDQHANVVDAHGDHVVNNINDQFSVQYLHSKLSALEISQVDSITVFFQLSANSSRVVTLGEEERLSHVNNNKEIIVSRALLGPSVSTTLAVSSALCKLLGIETYLAGTIACLMTQAEDATGSTSNKVVDGIKLLQLGNDDVLLNEKLRGVPGNHVQERDLSYIENKPFRIFRVGEVVAYLADDGEGPMTYGKVLLVGDAIDAGLRKIKVSSSADNSSTIDLLSTDVYSFKSAREMSSRTSTGVDYSPAGDNINGVASVNSEMQSPVNTTPALASSNVSRTDLMDTLNGLLHRLNIPTDMQEGSLMDRIVTLNEANAKLEEQLRQEVQSGIDGRAQMNKMAAAMKCQICINEDVTHVMAPCGHTICLTCLQQLQRNKCPFCRTNINLKVKFFTSDNETS